MAIITIINDIKYNIVHFSNVLQHGEFLAI